MSRLAPMPLSPFSIFAAYQAAAMEMTNRAIMATNLSTIHAQSQWQEFMGNAVPAQEPAHHFLLEHHKRNGRIPETKLSVNVLENFPFCRVWSFERAGHKENDPVFVVKSPYSGRDATIMNETVVGLLPYGNVVLAEQRDAHYIAPRFKNGLDQSTAAFIEVISKHPGCHVLGESQSGVTATVATAWIFQKPALKHLRPASLTVIGSPINAQLTPGPINKLATGGAEPLYVAVGPRYPGAGRLIVPGAVSKLVFSEMARETAVKFGDQAMPIEHIRDTLQRVFREFWLAEERYKFAYTPIHTRAIACPVLTFSGAQDKICPPAQVHDLHRLTPNAADAAGTVLEGRSHYDLLKRETVTKEIVPAMVKLLKLAP